MDRCVFSQRVVDVVLLIVVHLFADQPAQRAFVQCHHIIQDLAPATAHAALRRSVLPRRLDAAALRFQAGGSQESHLNLIVGTVEKPKARIAGKRITKHRRDPGFSPADECGF